MPDPGHEARIPSEVDQRFDRRENEMRTGFAEMLGKLDQTAGGVQRIVELLTGRDGR